MANLPKSIERAKDFFENQVFPFWRQVVCKWPEDLRGMVVPLMLGGIFMKLNELVERLGQGSTYFRITPFVLVAGDSAIKVVQKETQGLTRRVFVWVDSAIGAPDPVIRIGTSRASSSAGGVALIPGQSNEIGKIPYDTELWMSSAQNITVYIVEEA